MFWTYINCSFQAFEMHSKLYLRCIPSIHQKNATRPRLHSSCNVCHPQIHIAQGIITRASQDQFPIGSRSGTFSNGSAKSSRRQRDFDPRRSGPVFEDGDFFCLKEDGDFFPEAQKCSYDSLEVNTFLKQAVSASSSPITSRRWQSQPPYAARPKGKPQDPVDQVDSGNPMCQTAELRHFKQNVLCGKFQCPPEN